MIKNKIPAHIMNWAARSKKEYASSPNALSIVNTLCWLVANYDVKKNANKLTDAFNLILYVGGKYDFELSDEDWLNGESHVELETSVLFGELKRDRLITYMYQYSTDLCLSFDRRNQFEFNERITLASTYRKLLTTLFLLCDHDGIEYKLGQENKR